MTVPLSILIHAYSKTGKTTLAGTCPPPLLVLDAEGRTRFLPHARPVTELYGRPVRLTSWTPSGPPPRYDGTWDICVVQCNDWLTVERTYQWLTQGQHDFVSLALDSITELQRRCRENLKGDEQMRIQDWGALLDRMTRIIRGFRDLTLHPTKPLAVVMFIAETRQDQSGKWKPNMQGQIVTALPYWMDITGYLYKEATQDVNGQPTGPEVRKLLISQHPQFEAGEAVQGVLGDVITNPNIYVMHQTLNQFFGTPMNGETA